MQSWLKSFDKRSVFTWLICKFKQLQRRKSPEVCGLIHRSDLDVSAEKITVLKSSDLKTTAVDLVFCSQICLQKKKKNSVGISYFFSLWLFGSCSIKHSSHSNANIQTQSFCWPMVLYFFLGKIKIILNILTSFSFKSIIIVLYA